jgi:hypothetical protein
MADQRVRITPEEVHLAEQQRLLAELTEHLATMEAEFASNGATFARFRVSYLRRFAPLYAELDRLEAEILRLVAERTPPDAPEAEAAQAQADEAEARADESESAAEGAEANSGLPPEPSADLKSLYRQVARSVHPDLGDDDERERRTRLMAAASEAYARGDEAALQRILDGEAARPESVKGEDTGARLVRVLRRIAQVRGRLAEIVQLSAALEADPMWKLFDTVRVAGANGVDPLDRTEKDLRTQVRSAKAQLAALRTQQRA